MTNNQLAENSITQLLNSVKLARDNAERDDNRVDHSFYYALTIALEELQERRKADSEPVAYIGERMLEDLTEGYRSCGRVWPSIKDELSGESRIPLYRHAQPAPVVPKDVMPGGLVYSSALPKFESNDSDKVVGYYCFISGKTRIVEIQEQAYADAKAVLNAFRAAMLQAQSDDDGEPTDDERIMAIEGMIGCLRCGDNGWVVGEMGITRCACAQAGNSPVIGIDMASGPDRTVEVRYVAPPGYVMVPKEPTERMVIDGFESEPDETFSEPEVWEKYQKMSGCEQAAYRARLCWAAMIAVAPPAPNQENI